MVARLEEETSARVRREVDLYQTIGGAPRLQIWMSLGSCEDAGRAKRELECMEAVTKSSPELFVPDGIQKPRILAVLATGLRWNDQHVIGSRARNGCEVC
jgi:hypothetical protein